MAAAPAANSPSAPRRALFLPKLSLKRPPTAAPTAADAMAALTMRPCTQLSL